MKLTFRRSNFLSAVTNFTWTRTSRRPLPWENWVPVFTFNNKNSTAMHARVLFYTQQHVTGNKMCTTVAQPSSIYRLCSYCALCLSPEKFIPSPGTAGKLVWAPKTFLRTPIAGQTGIVLPKARWVHAVAVGVANDVISQYILL